MFALQSFLLLVSQTFLLSFIYHRNIGIFCDKSAIQGVVNVIVNLPLLIALAISNLSTINKLLIAYLLEHYFYHLLAPRINRWYYGCLFKNKSAPINSKPASMVN